MMYTHRGEQIDIFNLDDFKNKINIHDIAHALSNICRFGGHTNSFYSVAEHSVRMSWLFTSQGLARHALLHDASEAYLLDLPRPLKESEQFFFYRKIEKNIQNAIYTNYEIPLRESPSIIDADNTLLVTEIRDLMPEALFGKIKQMFPNITALPEKIIPWNPKDAYQLFLEQFSAVTRT